MIRNQYTCNRTLLMSFGLCAAAWSLDASAQGYPQPHSLQWPLYESKVVNGTQVGGPGSTNPRPAVGNVVGEYQSFSGQTYLHSGTDIRGVMGDPVFVMRSGNVWFRANFSENSQDCISAINCRLYVKGDDGYIYYYSHLRLDKSAPEFDTKLAAAIIAANARDPSQGTYPVQPGTEVTAGQRLTSIADFGGWNHLHFGMVDSNDGYRVIDPLTALSQAPSGAAAAFTIVDDERPTVASLRFVTDGASQTEVVPSGDCRQISGKLDIAAQMRDSFYSRGPAPTGISGGYASIAVSSASYAVRHARTGETVQQGNWANFTRFPICGGSDPACPQSLSEAQFVTNSINANEGALTPGLDYTKRLYWDAESCSIYTNDGAADATWSPGSGTCNIERFIHLLTNNISTDSAWDTSTMLTGRYEVTAEAVDAAGNRAARSTFVTVDNGGGLSSTGDAYVRDNARDLGNLPSTAGNMPFWVSPDIVVAVENSPAPTNPDTASQVRIVANQTYDVYVFVHNDTCVDLPGVRVEVFSANPALIQRESDWVHVTNGYEGAPGSSTGLPVPQLDVTRMGPYKWTPTDAEASQNNGHRCMLARIDAPLDPIQKDVEHVADDNNIAQLNLQIDSTSFKFVGDDAGAGLNFDCGNFPVGESGAQVTLMLDAGSYADTLVNGWNGTLGAKAIKYDSKVFVDFSLCSVHLPGLSVPSNTLLPGEVEMVLPSGYFGTFTVTLSETINNVEQGGQAFSLSRTEYPPIN